MTDLTGAASSAFTTTEPGVKAFIDRINAAGGVDGVKVSYVMADTTSTPTGALLAAQELVQKDHVFLILENSSVFYGALQYTLQAGIPVIGSALDGPVWTDPKNTNLFAAAGVNNAQYAQLDQGEFMKEHGVTSCASLGYSSSESNQQSSQAFIDSCKQAGLKEGYLNTQIPFGSTDMGAVALAMKNAGVDGMFLPVSPNTAFALVAALTQIRANMKVIMLGTGYGGDLLASKAAVQSSQGVYFSTIGNPAEANTPATRQRAADLAKVGVSGPPTFAEQEGYLLATALVAGMKATGPHASRAKFMSAMSGIKDFNGNGLLSPLEINFRDYAPSRGCLFVAVLKGNSFQVPAGTPLCGGTAKI